jgi:hypothetical protein
MQFYSRGYKSYTFMSVASNLMPGLLLTCQSWSTVEFGYIQHKLDDIRGFMNPNNVMRNKVEASMFVKIKIYFFVIFL